MVNKGNPQEFQDINEQYHTYFGFLLKKEGMNEKKRIYLPVHLITRLKFHPCLESE